MSLNNIWNWETSLDEKELPTLPTQEQIEKTELSPQEQFNQRLAQELDRIRTLAIQEKIEQWVPVDFTPDRFYFSTMIDIEPNKEIISNPIIISWINVPVVMKIEEWTIIQNGVDTGKNYILVQNGDKIELKVSSAELHWKEKSVTVDIWWQTWNFTIITRKISQ